MLDFMKVSVRFKSNGVAEIYPKFIIKKSSDLMIRGRDFYAIWIEERGLWSTDEEDVVRLVDRELNNYLEEHKDELRGSRVLYMWDAETGVIDSWHKYCQKQMRDSFHMLDENLIFSNTVTTKSDYASKRLPYPLENSSISAYEKLISTLYSEDERRKIEWAIGSIISGDSKHIQKFMVLYGEAGAGKSTILNIIQQLFEGYFSVFDAKALGSSSNQFALEAFKTNPLVAIQHDGDLSRIEDNTRINSLVSHEMMTVNEKFKGTYSNRFKCFLFMGTNKPVKITDAKSGLIRRLIDVSPSGNKLSLAEYNECVNKIKFELGGIAKHCLDVYLSDTGIYDNYIPTRMLGASNDFYNFVIDSFSVFKKEDGTTLKAAWEMYKTYCDEAKIQYPYSQRNFKEELKNYFRAYNDRFSMEDGSRVRSYYSGFRIEKFDADMPVKKDISTNNLIQFEEIESIFDKEFYDCPAQYATSKGTPKMEWREVTTTLSDLDTSKLHYVMCPHYYIIVDFDLKDENGNKSFEKNLEAASKWPPTYAELSKSGAGIHLHYIYTGDINKLSRLYAKDIEIKIFKGNSALRRKLTKCNNVPIATISSGLPLKGDDNLISFNTLVNEKAIRTIIKKNLNKEYHASTKCSIDFINKTLEDAYKSGMKYDVSDLKNDIIGFAAQSTNQSDYCMKLAGKMKFKSEEPSDPVDINGEIPLVFFDIEVFPNLFLVNWKLEGEENPVIRMINPKPKDIEDLLKYRLVGFNNRRYDNHMLYACLMGYSNEALYNLSCKIINSKKGENKNCFFGEAYNISYTDVYDFAAKKQSLKKWEIELGIHHQELGLPWDKPVPEDQWIKVAEYCDNDVIATETVFHHLKGDFLAREILAELAGMTVNDTTNSLTTRFIFGKEKRPDLIYTDLATGKRTDGTKSKAVFPGYEYKDGRNLYRGTDMGYGGYVYAQPGIYYNVALLDIASMHPNSIIILNAFGSYTERFKDILDTRIYIKHKEYDKVRKMFNGKLEKYLDDEKTAKALAQALKIAINSVYGLTSANFDNPFRDIRNKNNIVALCGALFMRTLQDEVQKRGFTVAHIKTDSIKIPNATPEIIEFAMEFAKSYGYTFEHEATYERMCLVNDAVYIAKFAGEENCKKLYGYAPGENVEEGGQWTATGTQFAVPYVFKTLFSKENILFEDMCETKSVSSSLYLDMNESLPENEHNYCFVGKVGSFCPIKSGCGGGELLREGKDKEGNLKYSSATGAKGYRWMESEVVKELSKEDCIDISYYRKLVDDAVDTISKYGDFETFVSDYIPEEPYVEEPPWLMQCGRETCIGCEHFNNDQFHMDCSLGYDISDLVALNSEKIY